MNFWRNPGNPGKGVSLHIPCIQEDTGDWLVVAKPRLAVVISWDIFSQYLL